MIRKAEIGDLNAIERIYQEIHDAETAGLLTTGWIKGIYPTRATAEAALARDDLYVIFSHCFNDGNKRATEALINYLKKCE